MNYADNGTTKATIAQNSQGMQASASVFDMFHGGVSMPDGGLTMPQPQCSTVWYIDRDAEGGQGRDQTTNA